MLHAANHVFEQSAGKVAILLAVAAVRVWAGSIEPQTEPVSVYLNVEKDGGLVTGLTQANFRLFQDGKALPFRVAEPEKTASIALLVEYNTSSGYFGDDLNASIQGFGKYAPEGHWYALAT